MAALSRLANMRAVGATLHYRRATPAMYLKCKRTPGLRHDHADSGSLSRQLGHPHVPANSFTTSATMRTVNTTQLKMAAPPHKNATSMQDCYDFGHVSFSFAYLIHFPHVPNPF